MLEHMKPRVLVVDDEQGVRRALQRGLTAEGMDVVVAADGPTALGIALTGAFDVILLDIMLPGLSGYRVLQRLRERGVHTPVLLVSAKDGEVDQADGLDLGADGYLVKPFSFVVLVAQVRAMLRRGTGEAGQRLTVGDLVVDRAARRVLFDGEPISLSPREFAVLEALAGRAGSVVTKDELLRAVWGDEQAATRNAVEVYVGYLRRKLDAAGAGEIVRTVRGHGYLSPPPNWRPRSTRPCVTRLAGDLRAGPVAAQDAAVPDHHVAGVITLLALLGIAWLTGGSTGPLLVSSADGGLQPSLNQAVADVRAGRSPVAPSPDIQLRVLDTAGEPVDGLPPSGARSGGRSASSRPGTPTARRAGPARGGGWARWPPRPTARSGWSWSARRWSATRPPRTVRCAGCWSPPCWPRLAAAAATWLAVRSSLRPVERMRLGGREAACGRAAAGARRAGRTALAGRGAQRAARPPRRGERPAAQVHRRRGARAALPGGVDPGAGRGGRRPPGSRAVPGDAWPRSCTSPSDCPPWSTDCSPWPGPTRVSCLRPSRSTWSPPLAQAAWPGWADRSCASSCTRQQGRAGCGPRRPRSTWCWTTCCATPCATRGPW